MGDARRRRHRSTWTQRANAPAAVAAAPFPDRRYTLTLLHHEPIGHEAIGAGHLAPLRPALQVRIVGEALERAAELVAEVALARDATEFLDFVHPRHRVLARAVTRYQADGHRALLPGDVLVAESADGARSAWRYGAAGWDVLATVPAFVELRAPARPQRPRGHS